jgi:hypothetical protein
MRAGTVSCALQVGADLMCCHQLCRTPVQPCRCTIIAGHRVADLDLEFDKNRRTAR